MSATWYGAKFNQGESVDHMKRKMEEKGWTYLTQEGSGYFFEKGKEKAIITSQSFSFKNVLFKVPVEIDL